MLEGLDQINWGRLTHAYGSAEDVPTFIRALRSPDASDRKDARHGHYYTIFHQGWRYRASAPAVPFLFEVLEAPDTQDKVELIDVLTHLAVGYPEHHLPFGYDYSEDEGELRPQEDFDRIRAADPDDNDWEPDTQPLWRIDAHQAVLRGVGTFQRLTQDSDQQLREAAVKALAWFPEAAAESVLLVRQIAYRSPEAEELANAIICLGILDRYTKDLSHVPSFRGWLHPTHPYIVRVAAAISLAVILEGALSAEALSVLLAASQEKEREGDAELRIAWHWPLLTEQVSDVLECIHLKPTEPVLSALCHAAETVESSAMLSVFFALLAVVFGPRYQNTSKVDPTRLTAAQLRALRAITRNPTWKAKPFSGDITLAFGMPYRLEKFQEFLEATEQQ